MRAACDVVLTRLARAGREALDALLLADGGSLALWAASTALVACGLAGGYVLRAVSHPLGVPAGSAAARADAALGVIVLDPFILMLACMLGLPLTYALVAAIRRLARPTRNAVRPPKR